MRIKKLLPAAASLLLAAQLVEAGPLNWGIARSVTYNSYFLSPTPEEQKLMIHRLARRQDPAPLPYGNQEEAEPSSEKYVAPTDGFVVGLTINSITGRRMVNPNYSRFTLGLLLKIKMAAFPGLLSPLLL